LSDVKTEAFDGIILVTDNLSNLKSSNLEFLKQPVQQLKEVN